MVGIHKIMIVEDESLVAEDLHVCISGLGYEIVGIADTYDAAVTLAESGLPDLALLDIRIKGERDGIALAEVLRRRGIGFVYLTSHADRNTLERAEVTEPLGYVMKPFNRRELLPVIKMALYRHLGETKLRTMERWLSTTLRSIGDGVAVTDLDGRVSYLNPAAEAITGRPLRHAMGRSLAEVLPLVDASSGSSLECVAVRAMREDAVIELAASVDLVQPGGSRVAIEDSAAPVREEDGSIQGAVVVFKDAGERRRLERERQEAALRMERAERLESLGVIAGGLAHDFNNALLVIAGNVELCRRVSSGDALAYLGEIEREIGIAEGICRHLLEGAGAAPLQRELFALAPVVAECLSRTDDHGADGVHWLDDVAGGDLELFADPLQFRQVLINFLSNACEALGPRGGTIRVRAGRRDVGDDDGLAACADGPLEPGSYVWVEVQDDGRGMSEEVVRHLFQPFFTTKATGRGLGLSSVRGIVRRHGGGIAVESRPGQGTTFRTWWPLPAQAPSAPGSASPESGGIDIEHLLVVDDDPGVRGVTCRLLESRGLTCHAYASGPEALAALRAGLKVDAVLLDLLMPEMSGYEVLAALRAESPSLPVLLVSGYSDTALDCLRDDRTDVLAKPFTSATLWSTLRGLAARRES